MRVLAAIAAAAALSTSLPFAAAAEDRPVVLSVPVSVSGVQQTLELREGDRVGDAVATFVRDFNVDAAFSEVLQREALSRYAAIVRAREQQQQDAEQALRQQAVAAFEQARVQQQQQQQQQQKQPVLSVPVTLSLPIVIHEDETVASAVSAFCAKYDIDVEANGPALARLLSAEVEKYNQQLEQSEKQQQQQQQQQQAPAQTVVPLASISVDVDGTIRPLDYFEGEDVGVVVDSFCSRYGVEASAHRAKLIEALRAAVATD